jgi:hypothetical protein
LDLGSRLREALRRTDLDCLSSCKACEQPAIECRAPASPRPPPPEGSQKAALGFIRAGDVFVVTKLDRPARSVADLCAIVKRIENKGGALRILAMRLDAGTSTGRLMLNVSAGVAQFEREGKGSNMGQFSVEKPLAPGSALSGNQQLRGLCW